MAELRLLPCRNSRRGSSRSKVDTGSQGSVSAGEQICRLSARSAAVLRIAAGFKRRSAGRAKIDARAGNKWVTGSREAAGSSEGTCISRAKVILGSARVTYSRKAVRGPPRMQDSRSAGQYGLLK